MIFEAVRTKYRYHERVMPTNVFDILHHRALDIQILSVEPLEGGNGYVWRYIEKLVEGNL